MKRVVVVEEGQHVQISAADVRLFGGRRWRDVAGQRQLYHAVHKPTITAQLC